MYLLIENCVSEGFSKIKKLHSSGIFSAKTLSIFSFKSWLLLLKVILIISELTNLAELGLRISERWASISWSFSRSIVNWPPKINQF